MSLPQPQKKEYSYADYLTWPENERWEIFDGVAYMQSAPSRQHQEISMELSTQFHNYLRNKPCQVFAAPFCVVLDDYNVVEPDITIVCDSSKLNEKGCNGAPDMIIEILSPSTSKNDRLIKFNKYENAGVKLYWIVEPDQKLVSVFSLQSDGRYGRIEMYTEKDKIKVSIFSDLEIDLKSVFDDKKL